MEQQFQVPVDNPNADTEWNDILRKHGIIPEKPPSPSPIIEEAILKAQEHAHEHRLDDKDLDELAELEDEEDEEFLEIYRKQRLAELSQLSKKEIHGQVYPLQKPDYARDVTEASHEGFVFVNLFSSMGNNVESRVLTQLWRDLARTFGDIKFCEIRADLCIEGYPEKNTPTILVYRNGDIVRQIVTLRELRGVRTELSDLVNMLIQTEAVKDGDVRVQRLNKAALERKEDLQNRKEEEQDDDWD